MENFKNKPYFPMFLGNGIDGVLIGPTGSALSSHSFEGTYCYWYKADRRDKNRWLIPLLQSGYRFAINNEKSSFLQKFDQTFDPEKAILHTKIDFGSILGILKLEVETFLTDRHTLVEHYAIKSAPKGALKLSLILVDEKMFYREGIVMADVDKFHYSGDKQNKKVSWEYRHEKLKGQAFMYFEGPGDKKLSYDIGNPTKSDYLRYATINIFDVKVGECYTKYTTFVDNKDNKRYKQELLEIYGQNRQKGYEIIKNEHKQKWENYFSKSKIKIPDQKLQYIYSLSRYLIKAVQNPIKGNITSGIFGGAHQGQTFWDGNNDNFALLKHNNIAEAYKMEMFWKNITGISKTYAMRLKKKGLRFGWAVDSDGRDDHACKHTQYHNNGYIAWDCFNYYLYTGDKKALEELYYPIKGAIDFLIDATVEKINGKVEVAEIRCLDETKPRKNDTWNITILIKALECLIKASGVLNKNEDLSGYIELKEKLKILLKNNFKNGVLLSFENAPFLNYGSPMYYYMYPDKSASATLKKFEKDCMGVKGLTYLPHSFHVFTRIEALVADVRALIKDNTAVNYLNRCVEFTNYFGGLGEWLLFHDKYTKYYHIESHAFFLIALSDMLAHKLNNEVRIFCAIPDEWKDIDIRDIRLEGGILVSATLKKSKLVKLTLKNTTDETVKFKIVIPNKYLKNPKFLPAGEIVISGKGEIKY